MAVTTNLLRSRAIPASVDHDEDSVVDIVGAGYWHSAFNISMTAIIAAGAGVSDQGIHRKYIAR